VSGITDILPEAESGVLQKRGLGRTPKEERVTKNNSMARRALSAAVVVGLLPVALGFQTAVSGLTPLSAGACPRFHGMSHACCVRRPSPGSTREIRTEQRHASV
jgi:hypothetical protein